MVTTPQSVKAVSGAQPSTAGADEVTRRIFGRGSGYLIVWVLQFAGSVIVTPILTRVLNPRAFGQTVLALTLFQVIVGIAGLSLQSGIQRLYVEDKGEERARGVLFMAIVLTCAVGIAIFLTGDLWARFFGFSGDTELVRLTVLWAAIGAIATNCLGLLRSQDRLAPFAAISLLQSVVAQAIAIGAVLIVGRNAVVYLTGLLTGQIIAAAIAIVVVRPSPKRALDVGTNLSTLAFSLPLIPSVLGAFVLNAGDRIVVKHYLGLVQVGRYQIAYNVGCFGILMLGVVNQSVAPMFFAIKEDALRWEVLARMRDHVLELIFPFVAAVCIASPIVLRIWAPPSYRPNSLVAITCVVVISTIPYAMYVASIRILLWHRKTGLVAWSSGTAAVLNVLLNIALVPHFGIMGSAVATLICYVWLGICAGYATRKYVLLRRPGWPVFGSVGLALVSCYVGIALPTSPAWLIIRLVLAVGFGILLLIGGRRLVKGPSVKRQRYAHSARSRARRPLIGMASEPTMKEVEST